MRKPICIIIDPRDESVKKVEMPNDTISLDDMLTQLECEYVDRVPLATDSHVDLWVDDEGLVNGATDRIGYFNVGTWQFAGKGLICSFNESGESLPLTNEIADRIINLLPIQF